MKIQGVNFNNGGLQTSTTVGVIPTPPPPYSFGILKGVKKREYGEYMWGEYKGYNIEVYDAFKFNQFLIYVSDKCRNFVKSKLIYWQDGEKKITKSEGRR